MLESERDVGGGLHGARGHAGGEARPEDDLPRGVRRVQVAAVHQRHRLFSEHQRKDRKVAGPPEDRRLMPPRDVVPERRIGRARSVGLVAGIRQFEIVVAFVKNDDVVFQVAVVVHRRDEGPDRVPGRAEIDHRDRNVARTDGVELALDGMRPRLVPRKAIAEHRAAAKRDHAHLAWFLASDGRAAITPDVQPGDAFNALVQVNIEGEQCRETHEHHGHARDDDEYGSPAARQHDGRLARPAGGGHTAIICDDTVMPPIRWPATPRIPPTPFASSGSSRA